MINTVNHNQSGFSLVELSSIIMVIAILMVGYLSWTVPATHNNAAKTIATQKRMTSITQAMGNFLATNNRLPCPANPTLNSDDHNNTNANALNLYDFDDEALTVTSSGVTCPISMGAVPTRALGLPAEEMFDGWGRKFLYQVSTSLCGSSACTAQSYQSGTNNLTVNTPNPTLSTPLAVPAAYVLLSFGMNGYGGYLPSGSRTSTSGSGTYEQQNNSGTYSTSTNTTFDKSSTTTTFDDIVFFRSVNELSNAVSDSLPLDFSTCQSNNTTLQQMNRSTADTLRTNLTGLQVTDSSITYNTGDEVALELMWDLQEACSQFYGSMLSNTCPAGQAYDASNNRCACNSGVWSTGNC